MAQSKYNQSDFHWWFDFHKYYLTHGFVSRFREIDAMPNDELG